MKAFSDDRPEPYQILGRKLFINYDVTEEIMESMNGDPKTHYSYYSAVCDITANRSERIEAIITTKYSTNKELATINNKDIDPEAYEEYQNFRILAKQLADGWERK